MKQSLHFLFLVVAAMFCTLLVTGCMTKSTDEPYPYVQGRVAVGVKSSIPPEQISDFFTLNNLTIYYIASPRYKTSLSVNQIGFINNLLATKDYFYPHPASPWGPGNVYASPNDPNELLVNITFYKYNLDVESDWMATLQQLQLEWSPHPALDSYSMYIKVPDGTERYWRDRIKTLHFTKWAELDYILPINPHP